MSTGELVAVAGSVAKRVINSQGSLVSVLLLILGVVAYGMFLGVPAAVSTFTNAIKERDSINASQREAFILESKEQRQHDETEREKDRNACREERDRDREFFREMRAKDQAANEPRLGRP